MYPQLADAYEEVEEQRQVVGQWKRRVQKLNGEMHDLRLLLEEQTARNNLLEKKQRKWVRASGYFHAPDRSKNDAVNLLVIGLFKFSKVNRARLGNSD